MEADSFFRRWAKTPDDRLGANDVPDAARIRETASDPVQIPAGDTAADAGSEVAAFLRPDADPDLRRAALKRLFADPHFGKPDGLDIYMDDYNAVVPLDAAMLASLDHAASLFKSRDAAREDGVPSGEAVPAAGESAESRAAMPAPPSDENADHCRAAGSSDEQISPDPPR